MFAGFTAVQTGPKMQLRPTRLLSTLRLSSSWPAPHLVRRMLQLSVPIAVTLAVFPALADHGWQVLSDGGMPAAMLVAVTVCAVAGITLGAAPAPGEPNVHDRQLDVILATFFIGGCVWLAAAWPEHFRIDQPLTEHQVIAAAALLTGGYLLVAGTRLTARLRFVLILPLIALPQITGRPTVLILLVAATIAATALSAIVRVRRNARITASATAETAQESTKDSLHPSAPGTHPTPALDAATRLEEHPPMRNPTPRASSSTPEIPTMRALIPETGPTP